MIFTDPKVLQTTPQRIISLVPSQTELLYYLGLEKETIGITKFCIHPGEWFETKARIGGTKSLNVEKIISLQPDLIIANNEENIKEQVEMLAEQLPVWVTDVHDLASALNMITDIGQLTGKTNEAENLVSKIKIAFNDTDSNQTKALINATYFIWRDPYMTIGGDTFISNMMKYAGYQNMFETSTRYPEVNIEQLKEMNCRLILLSSEPYPFKDKHIHELQEQLPCAKILLVDGEMFSWYGSRLLFSADYFKQLQHNVLRLMD